MAEKIFLSSINLNGNEIKNVALDVLQSDPEGYVGRVYYRRPAAGDTTHREGVRFYDGTNWIDVAGLTGSVKSANIRTIQQVAELYQNNTFPVGYTFEQFINDLYRQVLAEQNPDATVPPSLVLQITASKTVEVNSGAQNFVISKKSFNQGIIYSKQITHGEYQGSQTAQDSGCIADDNTLKIYNSNNTQVNETGNSYTEVLTPAAETTYNTASYKGKIDYSASTVDHSYTSYGNDKINDNKIPAGTTGYSGNVSSSLKATYFVFTNIPATSGIHTLYALKDSNNAPLGKFDYKQLQSSATGTAGDVKVIYPASWTLSIQFENPNKANDWLNVATDERVITDGYCILPTNGDPSSFIEGAIPEGTANAVAYKMWRSDGNIGARKYRIKLS